MIIRQFQVISAFLPVEEHIRRQAISESLLHGIKSEQRKRIGSVLVVSYASLMWQIIGLEWEGNSFL